MKKFESHNQTDATETSAMHRVAEVCAVVVVFSLLERCVRMVATLPESAYRGPSIAWGVVNPGGTALPVPGWVVVLAIVFSAAALARWERTRAGLARLFGPWTDWDHASALRVVVAVAAGIGMWTALTYAHNPYFGRSWPTDRMLLACLWIGILWRPAFLVPFTVLLVAFVGQLDHPLRDYPWTEINLVVRVCLIFASALIVGSFRKRQPIEAFLVVLCCVIAVNYWWSGLGKLRIGWIGHRHLNLLMMGAYANGWMPNLRPETVVRISEAVRVLNLPLMVFALVVEWGAIVLLWRRWTLVGLLAAGAMFHTGIFMFSGMLFWKWIAIELLLLWFLLSKRRIAELDLFRPAVFATSVVLILGCRWWVEGRDLSWYDTPLTYTVRVTGVGESGARYAISNGQLAPYSEMFFLAPFRYLTDAPQLTSVMGAAGPPHALADSLLNAQSAEAVLEIVHRAPPSATDSAQSARFDALVAQIGRGLNERARSQRRWTRVFNAPRHLWSFSRQGETPYASQEPLRAMAVDMVLTYYDGESLRDIERNRLRTIEVPQRALSADE